jgi:hypothetical protein
MFLSLMTVFVMVSARQRVKRIGKVNGNVKTRDVAKLLFILYGCETWSFT